MIELKHVVDFCFAGCDILFVPAAYDIDKDKSVTLDYYWELVHRARAFDNQFYVAAISGARNDNIKDYVLYGHTMIVDPFGRILKQAGSEEEVVYQELGTPHDLNIYSFQFVQINLI